MTKACGIKIGKDKRQSERQITYNMFKSFEISMLHDLVQRAC